jgi:hypothetical protein
MLPSRSGSGSSKREVFMSKRGIYSALILASCLFAAIQHPADSQTANLVAAFAFNEGSGTTFVDASGNNNHGTITGATWAAGRFGNALSFNGTNQLATVVHSPSLGLTNRMTLEAWVYPTAAGGTWRTVILKERPGQLVYALYGNTNANRPRAEIVTAATAAAQGSSALALNVWSHVASTYDGTTLRLYVNGVQTAATARTGNLVSSTSPLRIGGNTVWAEFFAGRIDEVRIYQRALSAAEIQADMQTPIGPADTTPPAVSLTAPAADATVANTITVTAAASDAGGVAGVQFLLDGSPLGSEDTAGPYSVSWDTRTATNTTHRLSARARDASGNSSVASDVLVTVANPPSLSITNPPQGSSITGGTVDVRYTTAGDLTGVDHVHFRLDSNSEVMDLTLDGQFQFTGVPPASHVLNGYLVRADHSKIAGTDALPVSFTTVAPDVTLPAVALTAPPDGAALTGTITVTADA